MENKASKLKLVNHRFLEKLKPLHNLSLLGFGLPYFFVIPLESFKISSLKFIVTTLILFSFISLAIFLILSSCYFSKNIIGEAIIDDQDLIINNKKFKLESLKVQFRIEQSLFEKLKNDPKKLARKLPTWGNYVIIENIKHEFLPTKEIVEIFVKQNAFGYSEVPYLKSRFSDILADLSSLIGGRSS